MMPNPLYFIKTKLLPTCLILLIILGALYFTDSFLGARASLIALEITLFNLIFALWITLLIALQIRKVQKTILPAYFEKLDKHLHRISALSWLYLCFMLFNLLQLDLADYFKTHPLLLMLILYLCSLWLILFLILLMRIKAKRSGYHKKQQTSIQTEPVKTHEVQLIADTSQLHEKNPTAHKGNVITRHNKRMMLLTGMVILSFISVKIYFSPIWQHSDLNHKLLIKKYLKAHEIQDAMAYETIRQHITHEDDNFDTLFLEQAQISAPEKLKLIKFLLLLNKQSIHKNDFNALTRNLDRVLPYLNEPIDAGLDILDSDLNLNFDHMMGIRAELTKLKETHCISAPLDPTARLQHACGLFLLPNDKVPYTTLLAIDAKQNMPVSLFVVILNLKRHRFKAMPLTPTKPCDPLNEFMVNLQGDPKAFLKNFMAELATEPNTDQTLEIGSELFAITDNCEQKE